MKEIRFGEAPLNITLVSAHAMNMEGGVQNHIRDYRRFLQSQGHNVLILAPRNSQDQSEEGVIYLGKARRINFQGTIVHTAILPVNPFELRRVHKRFNPDIVHLHSPEISVPSLQFLAQSDSSNFATFHAQYNRRWIYNLWRPIGIALGRKLLGKIVVSQACKDMFSAYYPGDYRVIPNGINTERFNPQTEPIKRYLDGKFNIVFIGRLEDRKGLGFLLKAYQKIRSQTDMPRLIVVGDGQLKKEYQNYVEKEGIRDVHFEGRVPNYDVPAYYATARANGIYCSPAYKGESFGIVLLEAMASRAPVIAGNNEGYRQVIGTRNEGILVKPQDTDLFAREIALLMEDEELRRRMADAGQAKARLFDWKYVGKQILSYYEECLTPKS